MVDFSSFQPRGEPIGQGVALGNQAIRLTLAAAVRVKPQHRTTYLRTVETRVDVAAPFAEADERLGPALRGSAGFPGPTKPVIVCHDRGLLVNAHGQNSPTGTVAAI